MTAVDRRPVPMNDLTTRPAPAAAPRLPASDREGSTMWLLHEALARSRQHEAQEAARRFALARRLTAGRRWARLAGFAARRAARARAGAGTAPLDRGSRAAVSGFSGAV
jgi:hypothetical protein